MGSHNFPRMKLLSVTFWLWKRGVKNRTLDFEVQKSITLRVLTLGTILHHRTPLPKRGHQLLMRTLAQSQRGREEGEANEKQVRVRQSLLQRKLRPRKKVSGYTRHTHTHTYKTDVYTHTNTIAEVYL